MSTLLTLLTGGGLVAFGGLVTGVVSNWLGAKRDRRTYEHERLMAREALAQERLDRAYTALGIHLSRYADWARSVHPFLGPVPVPDPPTDEERWRIETLVMNHGSPEVRRLLTAWDKQAKKIDNADAVIRLAEGAHAVEPGLDKEARRERQALEDYREAMDEAAAAIRARMAAELAGEALRA